MYEKRRKAIANKNARASLLSELIESFHINYRITESAVVWQDNYYPKYSAPLCRTLSLQKNK